METTDLIDVLQTHLDQTLNATVLVAGSNDRPTPSAVIEDWSIEQISESMSKYLTSTYDSQGNETARIYRIPYNCRVSIMLRDDGEVKASRLHDSLRKELLKLEAHPRRLNNSVSMVEMNGGGGVDHQFVNPTEAEFSQSVTFTTAMIYEDTDFNTIEEIVEEIEVTDL